MSKPQLRRLRKRISRAAKRRAHVRRTPSYRRPLVFEQLEDRRVLATFNVTGFTDGPGVVTPTVPGMFDATTLRAAVVAANASTGVPDTISLSAGTYSLTLGGAGEDAGTLGDLDITDDLTITGVGAGSTIVDASAMGSAMGFPADRDRVFHIPFQVLPPGRQLMVNFQDVTITGGLATDAGSSGSLSDAAGGGIYNEEAGTLLRISDSVITGNVADATGLSGDGQGGGLADLSGNLTISNTVFDNNRAMGDAGSATAEGGGIFAQNSTTAMLIDTTVSNNTAAGGNGTLGSFGKGGAAQGGGIYASGGTWSMIGSTTVDSNVAQGGTALPGTSTSGGDASGGGIYGNLATFTWTLTPGSTISRNHAEGGSGDGGGNAFGGGIALNGGTWLMENNTISHNDAIGGIVEGILGGGNASGGGVFNGFFGAGTFTAEYLTIAENNASGSTGYGGGIYNDPFGLTIPHGTIVAGNTASSSNPDVSGAFTSADFNLIGDVGTATGFGLPDDQVGGGSNPVINPLLGPLQNNGGPTETHELLANSPAIDKADPLFFPAFDQRGMMRPVDSDAVPGAIADIGSVEVAAAKGGASINIEKFTNGLDADTPTGPLIGVGNMAVFTYVVSNTGSVALTNVSVTDDQLGAVTNLISNGNGDATLDPMESWTYQAMTVVTPGQYMNTGTVTADDPSMMQVTDMDNSNYFGVEEADNIKIEKLTNGVNADDPLDAPEISPGSPITWTYEVTTAGPGFVPGSAIEIVDDAGTPGDTGDDFSISSGDILFISGDDGDGNLEVGETWIYEATGIAQDLSTPGASTTFILTGSSALDGPNGNIRTFSSGDIDLKASAFSRDSYGVWETAWLGAYSPGLGVTDNSEGDGGDGLHRVDNVHRLNYVLFAFSESVIVDRAFLDSVVNDSDLSIWVGTIADAFTNPVMLNDAVLNSLDLNEVNNTTSSYARWADFNSGEVAGNVLVLAASVEDPTPEDRFKIKKLDVREAGIGVYQNIAVVTAGDLMDEDLSHYTNPVPNPGIDIEKFTNGVNADSPSEAPQIAPGSPVTWTYAVTNTGNVAYAEADIVIVDDAGTPNYAGDDFSTITGDIVLDTVDVDGILSPGETWTFSADGIAQDLSSTGATITLELTGNSALVGTNGNIRTFTAGGISVNTSAFSRDSAGAWDDAWLGAYSSGLGVTDDSEGNGGDGLHRVDNVHWDNYVLFAFSEEVIVDRTFLDSVVNDSDITVWVGTIADAFTNPVTLDDTVLDILDSFEVNNTSSSSSRWANINAGELAGNVLVISASTEDTTPDDRFKIKKVEVQESKPGIYKNTGVVTAGVGGPTDSDLSHYRNQDGDIGIQIEKLTNGADADDSQGADVPVIDPGDPVDWTYFVTNTGDVALDFADVVVVDNNGTTGDDSDDFTPTFDAASDLGGDGILSPGETWKYEYSATASILLTVIDFDALAAGTIVNEQYSDVRLSITTSDPVNHPAMIVDSESPTGGDTDLATPGYGENNDVSLGKILIISEDGNEADPDDNAAGGTLIFEFDEPIRVNMIDILDIDHGETGGTVKTFDSANNLISTHAILDLGDNSFQSISIGDEGVSRMEVKLVGSGAVTELSFDRIYSNIATVTVDAVSASDPSHYRNPPTPVDGVVASKRFYVVDTYVDKTFEYDANGTPLDQNHLVHANYAPRGITMAEDGQTHWVIDKYNGVFVYDANGDSTGQWIAGGLSRPEGIATNETDIWIVDNASDKVFFYADAAANISGSQGPDGYFKLAAGNDNPSGITMAGQTIWVVNDGCNRDDVFVYDLNGNLQGSWRLSYNVNPRGITINPGDVNDIWIVDNKYDKVYEYDGGAFFTSGTHAPDAKWRLAGTNRKPEGITDPPPPVPESAAKDLVLATIVPPLDQVTTATLVSPFGKLAETSSDGYSTNNDAQPVAPTSNALYGASEEKKSSLFGDRTEELDAVEKEDDAILDAFFAELGDAGDDLLGGELVSAR